MLEIVKNQKQNKKKEEKILLTKMKLKRLARKWRCWDVALKVGLSETHYNGIENLRLKPTEKTIKKLEKVFNTPAEELFTVVKE
jgi:DNA-binding XRE family transcriptional regulator